MGGKCKRLTYLFLSIVFLLPSGDIFNTLASAEYEYYMNDGRVQTRATVPVWGNWCGPEYGSGLLIDIYGIPRCVW